MSLYSKQWVWTKKYAKVPEFELKTLTLNSKDKTQTLDFEFKQKIEVGQELPKTWTIRDKLL